MSLRNAVEGQEYIIRQIKTDDEELDAFLFSLGCYSGEKITVVSRRKSGKCKFFINAVLSKMHRILCKNQLFCC
jgi:Fe2+ transport system protein FeoA